jgi:hypothetical protein
LWIWRSQMQFYWRCKAEPVKWIFATVKSTIDTDNSSNTVLLFLVLWNSPNVYTLVIESIWRVVGVNCGFDGLFFLAEGIWKVHIFGHLFVCFQTSVYSLGEFHQNRNNSTVFEELITDKYTFLENETT